MRDGGAAPAKCCNQYVKRCSEAEGAYYCTIAKNLCAVFPSPDRPNNWFDCSRKCLQDKDQNRCNASARRSTTLDLASDHLECWTKCLDAQNNPLTGQPQPDDDPAQCL